MEKVDNKKRNILIVLAGLVAAVLIGLVVMVVVRNNSEDETEPEYSDGVIGGLVQDKFMVFYNLDFLTLSYNIKFSTTVSSDIEKFAFSDSEMVYSGENNPVEEDKKLYYDATIDVGSFVNYDAFVSDFVVDISDGRKYRVITRTDSLDENYTYIYLAILREGGDVIHILVNGDEKDVSGFEEFAKTKMGISKIVYNRDNE